MGSDAAGDVDSSKRRLGGVDVGKESKQGVLRGMCAVSGGHLHCFFAPAQAV